MVASVKRRCLYLPLRPRHPVNLHNPKHLASLSRGFGQNRKARPDPVDRRDGRLLLSGVMEENRRSPAPAAGGTTARRRFPRILALVSLVLFALALRLAGIDWGLPRSPEGRFFHPDEQHVAWSLSRMDPVRFDWNPGHMINPAFFYTLTGCAAVAAPGVPSPFHLDEEEFDRVPPETHARWIRTGRLVSAILGTVGILFAALTAAALYGSFAGYAAGLLLAVNPAHLVLCHYSAVDTPALAFLSISLWLTVRYTRSGGARLAMAAAFFAGVAAGTKYFAALVLAALVVGFLVRRVKRPLLWLSCGLLFGVGLVLAFPAVLDWRTLFGPNGIPRLLSYYPFNENVPKPTGPMLLNTFGFPLALLTAAGLGRALWKRDPIEAPATVLFFLYLFFLLRSPSPYHRHYLPLVATGVLFAAGALRSLLSPARRPLRAAAAIVATIVVLFALAESLVIASAFLEKDTREEASAWIAKNVPERTSIGLAGPSTGRAYYTPSIHEAKWSVAVTGYDRRLLAAYAPEFFLLTDVELENRAAHFSIRSSLATTTPRECRAKDRSDSVRSGSPGTWFPRTSPTSGRRSRSSNLRRKRPGGTSAGERNNWPPRAGRTRRRACSIG